MTGTSTNQKVVEALLDALSARSWDTMVPLMADDVVQDDRGTPMAAVHGNQAVAARMSLILDELESYEILPGTLYVAERDHVIAEIEERWTFPTGEQLTHPWVSVFDLRDGVIVRWYAYSDGGNIANQAPPQWLGALADKLVANGVM